MMSNIACTIIISENREKINQNHSLSININQKYYLNGHNHSSSTTKKHCLSFRSGNVSEL